MDVSHIINPDTKPIPSKIISSEVALPMDLQYHDLPDTTPLPVKNVLQKGQMVTLANALEIRTVATQYIISTATISRDTMRLYKNFNLHVWDTHNQDGTNFEISLINNAVPVAIGNIHANSELFKSATLLTGNIGSRSRVIQGVAGGVGASTTLSIVPCLTNAVLSGFVIAIKYGTTAPTTGNITIVLEMN
jgi:hypothetical protein